MPTVAFATLAFCLASPPCARIPLAGKKKRLPRALSSWRTTGQSFTRTSFDACARGCRGASLIVGSWMEGRWEEECRAGDWDMSGARGQPSVASSGRPELRGAAPRPPAPSDAPRARGGPPPRGPAHQGHVPESTGLCLAAKIARGPLRDYDSPAVEVQLLSEATPHGAQREAQLLRRGDGDVPPRGGPHP